MVCRERVPHVSRAHLSARLCACVPARSLAGSLRWVRVAAGHVVTVVWADWPPGSWVVPPRNSEGAAGPGPLSSAGPSSALIGPGGYVVLFSSQLGCFCFTRTNTVPFLPTQPFPTRLLPISTCHQMPSRVPMAFPFEQSRLANGLRGSAVVKWASWSAPSLARDAY